MADHIPFVFTERDCDLVKRFYGDSVIVRLSLERAKDLRSKLSQDTRLWVDGAVDGFGTWPVVSDSWREYVRQFAGSEKIGTKSFQENPDQTVVDEFVSAVLSKCLELNPEWLSIPQLPASKGSELNKINRTMATAAAKWRTAKRFRGKMILPIIITHQEQVNQKVARDKKTTLAKQCYARAGADGYWAVDATLEDWKGSNKFTTIRFPGVVKLHVELKDMLPEDAVSVGGPHWALNLALWTRQLIDYPAIGVGGRYRYLLPGGTAKQPKRRVALPPLRRMACATDKLKNWLGKIPSEQAYKDLHDLLHDRSLDFDEAARVQMARFYRQWYERIASSKPSGRALALFQDFSTAYVLGKALTPLPEEEETARRPEKVAEQFMLFCMPSA